MSGAIVIVSVFVAALQTPPAADSVATLRAAAERAARNYERAVHEAAPRRFGGGGGGRCDEVIGRFCFRFDGASGPAFPEPDPRTVVEAREAAVTAYRALAGAEASAFGPAAALVRYLVEAGRPDEAGRAAARYVEASGGDFRSYLLLGLSLLEAGDVVAAEAVFDTAIASAPPDSARALTTLELLLSREERDRYRRMGPGERSRYEDRVWALADPRWSEPGNERRGGQLARHAWIRILADRERVRGQLRWGRDHEEILLRYGLPVRRERAVPIHGFPLEDDVVEHFDSRALALFPTALLSDGYPPIPEPGARWFLRNDSARVSYAPIQPRGVLRVVVPVEHQATRFPGLSTSRLRVDGLVAADTVSGPPPAGSRAVLVVLDSAGAEAGRAEATMAPADSALRVRAEIALPPGRYVYGIEVLHDSAGLIALARHAVTLESAPGLAISDILVVEPDTAPEATKAPADPRALPRLVFEPGATVGLLARVTGLLLEGGPGGPSRFGVEWWLERAEPGSIVGRAARWVGRRLGLVDRPSPVRVRWDETGTGTEAPIRLDLTLPGDEVGLYRINLRVVDRLNGRSTESSRLVRLAPPGGG